MEGAASILVNPLCPLLSCISCRLQQVKEERGVGMRGGEHLLCPGSSEEWVKEERGGRLRRKGGVGMGRGEHLLCPGSSGE